MLQRIDPRAKPLGLLVVPNLTHSVVHARGYNSAMRWPWLPCRSWLRIFILIIGMAYRYIFLLLASEEPTHD
jgi:hypothetical protein